MDELWIGTGATYRVGSDSYPATVIGWKEYKSGARVGEVRDILVQTDIATVSGGQWPDVDYEYTPNPDGRVLTFRRDKKNRFILLGGGSGLSIGTRRRYNDPHF
jgi:hypothetical protein